MINIPLYKTNDFAQALQNRYGGIVPEAISVSRLYLQVKLQSTDGVIWSGQPNQENNIRF